jgi:hypothetical protein
MNRQKTYVNHLTGNGEPVIKHGVLTTEYQVSGGRNSGQLKHVREELAEIATKALNK